MCPKGREEADTESEIGEREELRRLPTEHGQIAMCCELNIGGLNRPDFSPPRIGSRIDSKGWLAGAGGGWMELGGAGWLADWLACWLKVWGGGDRPGVDHRINIVQTANMSLG